MDATQTLEAHANGDRNAASRLLPLVYQRLRALAAEYLRHERRGHTLQPTALVHEAYLRLIDDTRISWQGKTHFFAVAARQMRRILIESARAHKAQKRGGEFTRLTLNEDIGFARGISLDVLALNEAMRKLEELSWRQSQVVEMRFFGGLSVRETAHVLDVSERTVKQDWRVARAWLSRELRLDSEGT